LQLPASGDGKIQAYKGKIFIEVFVSLVLFAPGLGILMGKGFSC
jgi:hypothetical protein